MVCEVVRGDECAGEQADGVEVEFARREENYSRADHKAGYGCMVKVSFSIGGGSCAGRSSC